MRRPIWPHIAGALLLGLGLLAGVAYSATPPIRVFCQATPGTTDAVCPDVVMAPETEGVCVYVFDAIAGASTFNIRMRTDDGLASPTIATWASGATKTAVNEATTCFNRVTFTGPTLFGALVADVVVTPMLSRFHIMIDKTAAVSTQFEIYIYPLL